jgi:hypothetical protein
MKISNTNTLGAKGRGLLYPVTLNPVLYLSRTNGKFNKSTNGTIYVNEWIDPYSGLKATQDTGDYRPELVDDGVKFDGVDDYLVSPINMTTYSEFTFCAYSKFSIGSVDQQLFGARTDTPRREINIRINDSDRFEFATFDGNTAYLATSSVLNLNSWYFLIITFQAGNVKIYVDNTLDVSGDTSGVELYETSINQGIGGRNGTLNQFFKGILDEIIVFNYLLNDNQITNLYNYTKQIKGI